MHTKAFIFGLLASIPIAAALEVRAADASDASLEKRTYTVCCALSHLSMTRSNNTRVLWQREQS
jgi:hypothetical protein